MPLGLWKSKWEIHREDMARLSAEHREDMERYREECEQRAAEHREDMERYREESERRAAEHREEMDRHRAETERRHAEYRERMERFSEEMREERAAAEGRWLQLGEETSELREKYDHELAETRRFNREMLTRLDKTYANLAMTMQLVVDELHELKLTVRAQTDAIMKLVDRFEDPEGRPPV
jgi:kinesin family protein 4/21/27